MKVLRRHDPLIEDIIESASYVVLYSHDGQWVSGKKEYDRSKKRGRNGSADVVYTSRQRRA
jgi:hypothetical protein